MVRFPPGLVMLTVNEPLPLMDEPNVADVAGSWIVRLALWLRLTLGVVAKLAAKACSVPPLT